MILISNKIFGTIYLSLLSSLICLYKKNPCFNLCIENLKIYIEKKIYMKQLINLNIGLHVIINTSTTLSVGGFRLLT